MAEENGMENTVEQDIKEMNQPKQPKQQRKNAKAKDKPEEAEESCLLATELAKQIGATKNQIMRLVKNKKIASIKGKGLRSPYRIPESEIPKVKDMVRIHNKKNSPKAPPEPVHQESKLFEDFVAIQKNVVDTMNRLASTQEQVASIIGRLVDKM